MFHILHRGITCYPGVKLQLFASVRSPASKQYASYLQMRPNKTHNKKQWLHLSVDVRLLNTMCCVCSSRLKSTGLSRWVQTEKFLSLKLSEDQVPLSMALDSLPRRDHRHTTIPTILSQSQPCFFKGCCHQGSIHATLVNVVFKLLTEFFTRIKYLSSKTGFNSNLKKHFNLSQVQFVKGTDKLSFPNPTQALWNPSSV